MIDLDNYSSFVAAVTSIESNDTQSLINRMLAVEGKAVEDGIPMNASLLLTASLGLAAESGEFTELPKKIFLQGKPYTEAIRDHMILELSDVIWYWTNACRAIGVSPEEVIRRNVNKLENRYPGGKFDVDKS